MTKETTPKYVIFDTDMGTDDAWALLMLLKAEKCYQNVKVLAITCVHGNTTMENVIKNTYRVLESVDRLDIPIYKGATDALIPGPTFPDPFNGNNGMGDIIVWNSESYPDDVNALIRPENAVQIIRDLVVKYPKQVSLVCVAPLTNVALTLKTYSEFAENIKDIFLMGGNYYGIGNTTPCAEFNFYKDPEAAHIVLNTAKCSITVLPWESCLEENLNIKMKWRIDVLGAVNCKFTQFLNEAEFICYRDCETYMPCDAFLTAVLLFPDTCIQAKRQVHATVELSGTHTRGQMVLDHLKKNMHNVTIVTLLNENECKKVLHWTATA